MTTRRGKQLVTVKRDAHDGPHFHCLRADELEVVHSADAGRSRPRV
ncbi:MAG TPA: hypothetical protein VKF37_01910 [Chloroflexota bacterium]|nr:hypothetical protein [Chloroflexota bacterium]